MKLVTAAAAAIILSGSALGAECQDGSPDILKFTEWSTQKVPDSLVEMFALTVAIEHIGDRPFRMVDGAIWFTDALDRHIVGFTLDPDLTMAPGRKVWQDFALLPRSSAARLIDIDQADVAAIVCVEAVVYDDGTKETFD